MSASLDRIAFRLLILRCQTGDEAAFADLVRMHQDRLANYLRGLLGRDPADAMQDVWLAIWTGLHRLQDSDAFVAWALRIARDRAYQEFRRVRWPTAAVPDVAIDEPDEIDSDTLAALRSAMDQLPAIHRDVLHLRFVEGLGYEAIAGIMSVPVGTVRSRLFHAKRLLRERLQPGDIP